jgi:hypothetical protein
MRFQTYFGIPIPPFKEEKLGAGSATIRFVVTGKIPSKKNSQQAITRRQPARKYLNEQLKKNGVITAKDAHKAISMTKAKMRANIPYQEFIARTKPIIIEQMAEWSGRLRDKGLIFPLEKAALSLRFYFNNRYITDTVNKQQTIQDLLVEAGVIANDDYNSLNPIYSASACYVDELIYNIAFVSLSFRLPKTETNDVEQ